MSSGTIAAIVFGAAFLVFIVWLTSTLEIRERERRERQQWRDSKLAQIADDLKSLVGHFRAKGRNEKVGNNDERT